MMTLFDFEWRDEYLIFPAVKHAVSVLAKLTAWGFVGVALLWLIGLLMVVASLALCSPESAGAWGELGFASVIRLRELLMALLLPCLYLLGLWCHQVLLAERGLTVTRYLLCFLLFFAFLHPVCCVYTIVVGEPLLANQFILPGVLGTVLVCAFGLNWVHMVAAPLRLRVSLLLFLLVLMGDYISHGAVLLLLLPVFGFVPLRLLSRCAPLIVSLPPQEKPAAGDSGKAA